MADKKEKEYIMYKITCNTDESLIYIGSTTNFKCRKSQHKNCCNSIKSNQHNLKIYETIRNNGGWNNWTISPIEIYISNNKIKAKIRENVLMDLFNSNLNCFRAYTSKEERKEKQKKYEEKNKNKIIKNKTQKIICECDTEITKGCLSRHIKTSKKHQKYLCGLIKEEEK